MGDYLQSFYFIRHGETDWNKNHIFQGINDVPLNHIGETQAKKVVLPQGNFTAVFVSPLKRAKQTAEIIAKVNNIDLDLIDIPELVECRSEESARYIFNLIGVHQMPSFEKIQNEQECIAEFLKRVKRGLHKVFQVARDEKPLIVSHGGVFIALCEILELEFFGPPNCCLVDFSYNQGGYSSNFLT